MDFGEEHSPIHWQGVLVLPGPLWGSVWVLCAPFWGSDIFFERVFGLLRQIREESLNFWRWLDLNRWSRHDIREVPQMKERNHQLIPNIFQVVGPIQGYIRRPSHGERYMKRLEMWNLWSHEWDVIKEISVDYLSKGVGQGELEEATTPSFKGL